MSSSDKSFLLGVLSGAAVGVLSSCLIVRCRHGKRRCLAPRRMGGAIRLKSDQYDRYTQLHDAVWEGVLQRMSKSNMRNFTLYYHKETSTLFSHFEWVGHWKHSSCSTTTVLTPEQEKVLFEADMRAVASDPIVKEWWSQCEPCQQPFSQWEPGTPPSQGGTGDWWAPLVCLCHCGHWPTQFADELCRDPDLVPCSPKGGATEQPTKIVSAGRSGDGSSRQS